MRKPQLLVSVLMLVFLVVCAPQAAPAPAPQAPAPTAAPARAPVPVAVPAASAKPAWQEEWDRVADAAKREGTLLIYHTWGAQQRLIITNPFEDKYGVRIESVTGNAGLLTTKIFAEQRAGIHSVDVWASGGPTFRFFLHDELDSLEGALILPELTEPELIKKTWYFGEVTWVTKAHTFLVSLVDPQEYVVINTNLVKPGEITGYRDLLNPKWKGKISLFDPQVPGLGSHWFALTLELGDVDLNYIRELITKQEVFITRDARLQVEGVARGKQAIAIAVLTATTTLSPGRRDLGTSYRR